MSVIEVERPAPSAEPAPSWFAGWWNLALRLALLMVLVGAAVIALPSARPQASTVGDFLSDLKSGRVSSARYVSSSVEVRWSRDWSHWYHASLQQMPLPQLPPSPDHFVVGTANDGTAEQWLLTAIDATGHQGLDYGTVDNVKDTGRLSWADQLPGHMLSGWAKAAAVGAVVLMLFRREHRFGNRWAWFWVMLATSGLGGVLYLALEPSPIWQKPSRQRRLPSRPLLFGGVGLLLALALKPALSVLALLVSAS
jgi:hypothetical protein